MGILSKSTTSLILKEFPPPKKNHQASSYGRKDVTPNVGMQELSAIQLTFWPRDHGLERLNVKCPATSLRVRASFTSDNGLGSRTRESASIGTRLSQVLVKRRTELVGKINEGRKKLPMKIFLVLLGFYAANALATILGQTGDWDVLVAGIVVAIIELIGSFMYQKKYLSGRFKGFLIMVNYWKAGFTLGLFVDAFKVGS
ncbi:hypothetical protein GOP47_0025073 [Adiantum capillus-veneris]|uniref:Ycf20-like protein n=1 Tax=Adiantum capillus-veneris TaxID=13818 RepID=A0A9D4Z361_ADICA|nr:hypothetical protein GOP47_0025073 [Adiantum capillus-veneris]